MYWGGTNWLETWERAEELEPAYWESVEENIDALMDRELGRIDGLVEENLEGALAGLLSLVSFLNTGADKRPGIIKKLEKWIKRLLDLLGTLAAKFEASGFSISAGTGGISISLTFPPAPPAT